MDHSTSQKIRNSLRVLWGAGIPVTHSVTISVDDKGQIQELFTLKSDKLRAAEFSSEHQDAVAQHLESLLSGKVVVARLLGKDVVVSPDGVQRLKRDLKEQLGLELDTENAYLIDISEYLDKGNVSCNTQTNIRLHALSIKGLVELFDTLKPIKGAYPTINFCNVDPDELKACLGD